MYLVKREDGLEVGRFETFNAAFKHILEIQKRAETMVSRHLYKEKALEDSKKLYIEKENKT